MATMTAPVDKLKDSPDVQEMTEKLLKARCRLMTKSPWYGHIAMGMEWLPNDFMWQKDDRSKTMGVRIVNGGVIQCVWYPGFVRSQSVTQLYGVIEHEIEHIVRCHTIRHSQHHNPLQWNVAIDMTINGKKSSPSFGYQELATNEHIIPLDGNCVWLPEDWKLGETSETLYDMLGKSPDNACPKCGRQHPKQGSGGSGKKDDKGKSGKGPGSPGQGSQGQPGQGGQGQGGQGQGQPGQGQGGQSQGQPGQGQGQGGQGQGQDTCDNCGGECDENGASTSLGGRYEYGGYGGQQIDDHETWKQSDVSEEEARQLIKDLTDQATAKCQGHTPGHLSEALKALAKPVVRWRELLRNYIGNHVGNRRTTYSRRNRRNDAFGLPGVSHHAAATVIVIIDTSGSISSRELSQFFAEIEMITSRAKVHILQWDHAFQGFSKYKRSGWKTFKVSGRGGTDMAAPVQWITDNHLVPDCTIMLTDGHCNWSPKQPWYGGENGMITVITTPKGTTGEPDWGSIVHMKVN